MKMAITYDDFLKVVETNNLPFVNEVHKLFLDNGCKMETINEQVRDFA